MSGRSAQPRLGARAAWLVAVSAASAFVLHRAGSSGLAGPSRWHPSAIAAWANERGTIVVSMAAVRLAALALALYLGALGVLLLIAGFAPLRTLRSTSARCAPRVLRAALGLTVAPALVTTNSAAAGTLDGDDAPIMVRVGDADGEPADDTPVLHWQGAVVTTVSQPPSSIPTVPAPLPLSPPVTPQETWTVARGDHLWSIAAETVRDRTGAEPSTRAIAEFWRVLIDVNRDRLVDPDNPDLIFAGQEFVLPPQ